MTDNDRWVLEMMLEEESRLITPRGREAIAAALKEIDSRRSDAIALKIAGNVMARAIRKATAPNETSGFDPFRDDETRTAAWVRWRQRLIEKVAIPVSLWEATAMANVGPEEQPCE